MTVAGANCSFTSAVNYISGRDPVINNHLNVHWSRREGGVVEQLAQFKSREISERVMEGVLEWARGELVTE